MNHTKRDAHDIDDDTDPDWFKQTILTMIETISEIIPARPTPDFYLFDSELSLYYRGRYDDSRPGNDQPITGKDLHQACTSMLKGEPTESLQYPSMGCNIKWFEGNSPEKRS